MVKGTTTTGFEFCIDEQALNDMRFIEALAELEEGNPLAFPRVCRYMFDKEQKDRLYEHIADENGRVPIDKAHEMVIEIMTYEDESKNL